MTPSAIADPTTRPCETPEWIWASADASFACSSWIRIWSRVSGDATAWFAATPDTRDEDTTTPPLMASSTAPDTTNRAPYRAVSRIRTVRRGSTPASSILISSPPCW